MSNRAEQCYKLLEDLHHVYMSMYIALDVLRDDYDKKRKGNTKKHFSETPQAKALYEVIKYLDEQNAYFGFIAEKH